MAVNPMDLPTREDANSINNLLNTISNDLLIASDAVGSAIDMATESATLANNEVVKLGALETSLETLKTDITSKDIAISTKEDSRVTEEGKRTTNENGRVLAEQVRETNYLEKISNFVAETEKVEALYPTRLTDLENNKADKSKVITVEKELQDYKNTMANVNVNQEAKQKITGYGSVSLPKNTANGQVGISIKGNTDGTKSTIGASRLKSVSLNHFNKSTIIQGKTPSTTTGVIENSLENNMSSIIRLKPNIYYTRKILGNVGHGLFHYDINGNHIGRTSITTSENPQQTLTPPNTHYGILSFGNTVNLDNAMLLEGNVMSAILPNFETGKESTQYLTNVGELKSLPNGTKDEVRVSGGKAEHIQRVGLKTNVASGTVINYADMATGGQFVARASDGTTQTGVKGDTLTITAVPLTYQLAEPIITPIQTSGNLISYPSGTVYVENVVADAGVYTTKFDIKELQLPIKSIDKLIKYNFETGVQTVLDTSLAVINVDKKSFTHPHLVKGDMVFVDYFYDVESTQGETTIEYYDSRHTIKDTVNNKFYKWDIKSTNGVPTVALTEVL